MTDKEWRIYVRGLLKAELVRRNISYIKLSELLRKEGIEESPQNLSNKIARGSFSATFMLQVLDVIGCESIYLKAS